MDFLTVLGSLFKGITDAIELHKAGDEAGALAALETTINATSVKIAKMIADGITRRKTIAEELAKKNAEDPGAPPADEPTKPE